MLSTFLDTLQDELFGFEDKYLASEDMQTLLSNDRPLADAVRYLREATSELSRLRPPEIICMSVEAVGYLQHTTSEGSRLRPPEISPLTVVEDAAAMIEALRNARDNLADALDDLEGPRGETERPERESDREIIETLRAVGHRLTTGGLLREMTKLELNPADSTVKKRLAELVKDGRLTNDPKAKPRGYGLPEWGGSHSSRGS
jgi:hypothetical protein